MANNMYRSIVVKDKVILSVTATLQGEQLGFLQPEIITPPNATFSPQLQIEHFKQQGYDVDLDLEGDVVRIISAIPQNSPINHTQWMQTCAEYLAES